MPAIGKEPDGTDENDDRVRIQLGGHEAQLVEQYSFAGSIFQQPSAFSLVLAPRDDPKTILWSFPPGPMSPCSLFIGSNRQFTGELDAVNVSGSAHKTSVNMKGRDLMARLHDTDITAERSFNNATYEELYRAALKDVGLEDKITFTSNSANRKIRSGVKVKVFTEPVKVDEVQQTPSGGGFRNTVTAKLGETWLAFLERHFAKIGLFPWCDADGNFVLSRPNGQLDPTFHFYRKRGTARGDVANVEGVDFTNDTLRRFSEVVIFARNGGRKAGHNHTNGKFQDEEMVALGFERRRVHRDVNVTDAKEAEFYARRKIAEANRASWKLTYTISGHSAPTMADPKRRAVVCPDMLARVDDDELGIHENLYIESVEHRSPPRTTTVTMMRLQDLLFGEEQGLSGADLAKTNAKKLVNFASSSLVVFAPRKSNIRPEVAQQSDGVKRDRLIVTDVSTDVGHIHTINKR